MKQFIRNLIRNLIVFLIRTRLGVSPLENFQFANQKSNAHYFFDRGVVYKTWHGVTEASRVSLNWLLDDDCKIYKWGDDGWRFEDEPYILNSHRRKVD